jgi:hypothetical protein
VRIETETEYTSLRLTRPLESGKTTDLGAIGATISVRARACLLWRFWRDTGKVTPAAEGAAGDRAQVMRVPFSPRGADVPETLG